MVISRRFRGVAAAAVTLLLASRGTAGPFVYFDTPVDVSPTVADSWEDVDVSAYIPAGATGVLLHEINPLTEDQPYGVRKKGSTDTWMNLFNGCGGGSCAEGISRRESIGYHMVGVDANRVFQVYTANTGVQTYLMGYTTGDVTFFTNAIDKTPSIFGSWRDVDISADTGSDTAIAGIFYIHVHTMGAADDDSVGLRMNGSISSLYTDMDGNDATSAVVGVDANEIAEVRLEDADCNLYLVGYVTGGAVFFKNKVSKATNTLNSYVDVDVSANIGTDDATGVFFEFNNGDQNPHGTGTRPKSASWDHYMTNNEKIFGFTAIDGSNIFQQKIDDVDMNLFLVGYSLAGSPTLADHDAGQEPDAFTESGGEAEAELFGFNIDPSGSLDVTELVFRLSSIVGLTNADWANIQLAVDDDNDGDIGIGETTVVGGPGLINTAAGTITFSTSFTVSAPTNYVLLADLAILSDGDAVAIDLAAADITTTGSMLGTTTPAEHAEGSNSFERFAPWNASTPDTWEQADLSVSPFNVPGGGVVEIAVVNTDTTSAQTGGVRANGSLLNRYLQLHRPVATGIDAFVMHVQTDADSIIEHYASSSTYVQFILLGYWDSGTFVERFDALSASTAGIWEDVNLAPFGVGAGEVAEVVLTNQSAGSNRLAGARGNGLTYQRRLDLHNVSGSGVDAATMLALSDATSDAAIEVYAEDVADVGFRLTGYWSTPPRVYYERFDQVPDPATDATWEVVDLTTLDIPAAAIAEVVLVNRANQENRMGARRSGSSLPRTFDLHHVAAAGGDMIRIHLGLDASSTIEVYHEHVSDPHDFTLTGFWGPPPPTVAGWGEIEP